MGDKSSLNRTRQSIMDEMRNNPNITHIKLCEAIGIGKTAMQNNVTFLREHGYIERIGSNKSGYWKVII